MKGAILMLLGSANAVQLYQSVQKHAVAPVVDRSALNDLYLVGSGKSLKIEGFDIDVIWIYLIIVLILVGVVVGVILCCCGGKGEEEKKEGEEEKKEGDEEEKKEGEGEEEKKEEAAAE